MSRTSRSLLFAATVCLLAGGLHAQVTFVNGGYSGSFKAGEKLVMWLLFSNQGTTDAQDLALTITPGPGLHFDSVFSAYPGISCAPSGSTLVCQEAALKAKGSFFVDLTFSSDPGQTPDFRTTFGVRMAVGGVSVYSSSYPTYVAGPIDAKIALSPPPPLIAGRGIEMTATITNDGPYTLYDPNVVMTASFGQPFQILSSDYRNCEDSGGTLTCKYALQIAPGASRAIPFTIYSASSEKGPGTVTATVDPRNDDTSVANNKVVQSVPVTAVADVTTSLQANRWLIFLGSPDVDTAIHITSQSKGPSDSGRGTLTYDIPAAFTFQSLKSAFGSPSCATPPAGQAGRITCTDATAEFDITVNERAVAAGGVVKHQATVEAEAQDSDSSNNTASTTVEVRNAPDVSVTTMTAAPAHPRTGEIVTFEATVKNVGLVRVESIIVSHQFSAGLQYADGSTYPGYFYQTISLNVGETVVLRDRYYVTATQGPVTETVGLYAASELNTSDNKGSATVTVFDASAADVSVGLTGPTSPHRGEEIPYSIQLRQLGPAPSSHGQLRFVAPAAGTITRWDGNGFSCAMSGKDLLCTTGEISSSLSLLAYVRIAADAAGMLHAEATYLPAVANDPNPENDHAAADSALVEASDLGAAIAADRAAALFGEHVGYNVTITNDGPDPAANVVATITLPTGATLRSAAVDGANCSGTAPLVCRIDALAAHAIVHGLFDVTMGSTPGAVWSSIAVTTTAIDPRSANNSATAWVTLHDERAPSAPDLALEMSASAANIVIGAPVSFDVTVRNAGSASAANVHVIDVMPSGLAPLSADAGCTMTGQSIDCSAGSLDAGAAKTFRITAAIRNLGAVTNGASATMSVADPNALNNSATVTVTGITGRSRGARH